MWRQGLASVATILLLAGAAKVDGVPGDELLLGYGDGAHGQPETVLTLRHGRLMALPSPHPYGRGTHGTAARGTPPLFTEPAMA